MKDAPWGVIVRDGRGQPGQRLLVAISGSAPQHPAPGAVDQVSGDGPDGGEGGHGAEDREQPGHRDPQGVPAGPEHPARIPAIMKPPAARPAPRTRALRVRTMPL